MKSFVIIFCSVLAALFTKSQEFVIARTNTVWNPNLQPAQNGLKQRFLESDWQTTSTIVRPGMSPFMRPMVPSAITEVVQPLAPNMVPTDPSMYQSVVPNLMQNVIPSSVLPNGCQLCNCPAQNQPQPPANMQFVYPQGFVQNVNPPVPQGYCNPGYPSCSPGFDGLGANVFNANPVQSVDGYGMNLLNGYNQQSTDFGSAGGFGGNGFGGTEQYQSYGMNGGNMAPTAGGYQYVQYATIPNNAVSMGGAVGFRKQGENQVGVESSSQETSARKLESDEKEKKITKRAAKDVIELVLSQKDE